MTVETTITRLDLLRFNLAILPRLGFYYFLYLLLVVVALLTTFNGSGLPIGLSDWALTTVLCFFVAFISFTGMYVILLTLQIATASTSSGVIGAHEYVLTQDGFRDRTPQTDSLMKWSFIRGVVVTRSYALIKVSRACFYIVPKRSFSEQNGFEEFVSAAQSFWKSSSAS